MSKTQVVHTTQQYDYIKGIKPLSNPLKRIQQGDTRFYWREIEGEVVIYSSGTTVVRDGYVPTAGENKALNDWRLKMVMEGRDPHAYMMYRANYGTLMHILWGKILQGDTIPLDDVGFAKYVKALDEVDFSYSRVEELLAKDSHELRRDCIAFDSWRVQYKVKPLAIELMVCSDEHLVGTPLDLICEMTIPQKGFWGEIIKSGKNKDKPKATTKGVVVTAIVDFKSGRSGHFSKHAVQLLVGEKILKESHPDIKIDRLYNLSPTAWETKPSCRMTNQTNHSTREELKEILITAKRRHLKKSKTIKTFTGNCGEGTGFYGKVDLKDYLQAKLK